jgi:hypothetical protein
MCSDIMIILMMGYTIDNLTYKVEELVEGERIRVSIYVDQTVEVGSLYFERAKKSFNRKPVGMNGWVCVDAKVEGLYLYGGDNFTPKDIVNKSQQLIGEYMVHRLISTAGISLSVSKDISDNSCNQPTQE